MTRDETYDDDEIDDEMSEEHGNCAERTQRVIDTRVKVEGGKSHRLGRSREGSVKGGRPVER